MPTDDAEIVGKVITQVHASDQDWARLMVDVQEMSKAQLQLVVEKGSTAGVEIEGSPIVVVTTRGAKSGEARVYPLMRVEHGGTYALVGSLGGAPKNPTWYHNIKAHPTVRLQDGGVTRWYVARELAGAEREPWWDRAVQAYPSYAHYQSRCERVFPIFELTPVQDDR